ncbi:hypothetical protein NA63_2858 [Flavobacteriaceae bacterium MAR_2010_105]|nr:hypothetical protein NA63_2858 [Flavobacteriaceae bacterium MAR_2010_105]
MIKFFRTIRQNLLIEGKTTKYVKYAIGEIVLVVVGILIALQINNWNETRKTFLEENRILSSLKADLSHALHESNTQIIREKAISKSIQIVLTDSPEREQFFNHTKVDSIFYDAFLSLQTTVPVIQTYSDLKSSGKVSLITNQQIKERLTKLENSMINLRFQVDDNMSVQQLNVDKISIKYLDVVRMLIDRKPKFKITPIRQNDYRALLQNNEIVSTLALKLLVVDNLVDERVILHNDITDLIKLIENEIKTND